MHALMKGSGGNGSKDCPHANKGLSFQEKAYKHVMAGVSSPSHEYGRILHGDSIKEP